ncbi:MAG: hypothetical protein QW612_05915 [Candidatus Bathyarchaeia archaeon]
MLLIISGDYEELLGPKDVANAKIFNMSVKSYKISVEAQKDLIEERFKTKQKALDVIFFTS